MDNFYLGNSCKDTDETSSCFHTLTPEEIEFVNNNKQEIKFLKGEIIVKQGTKAASIMFLSEGLVKLGIQNSDKNLIISIKPGNHFIGLETLSGVDYMPYTVTALTNSKICYLDIPLVRRLMNQNQAFSNEILRVLNLNTIIVYNRMFSLTQKQLHGRLADILLCLSTKIFKSETFDLPLSRKDLASLTGMAPESVIRIMKDFKTDKLIFTSGKTIQILNEPMLQKISSVG